VSRRPEARGSVGAIRAGLLALWALGLLLPACARAATLSIRHRDNGDLVLLEGKLELADDEAFAKLVDGLDHAIVVLNSPGGNLVAGLAIGRLVRLRAFATAVPDDAMCASACALAWLGGTTRYLGSRSALGFHAASVMHGRQAVETGVGNALIGSYLARLGLSERAVVYITAAKPSDIQWLHPDDAKAVGIEFAMLPTGRGQGHERPEPAAGEAEPTAPQTAEAAAARYADLFFAHWSESNAAALRFYARIYAPSVNYRGTAIPREQIMDEKRRYVERWPTRVYLVRPGSVRAECDARLCTVTGDVAWDCRSAERRAETTGLATFTIQLSIPKQGNVQVAGEWGEVIARSVSP